MLLDELAHVGAGRFVRKIRGPKQTVIAEQLDVALGGDFFAALKIDLFSLQQLAGQGRTLFRDDAFQPFLDLAHEKRHPAATSFKKAEPQLF